jgi:hypothetical protein
MRTAFAFICALIVTSSAFAANSFCGKLTSLSYQTDIYSVIRMGIYNQKNDPQYITVKDSEIIELAIAIVSGDQNYQHNSDMDDYSWSAKDDKSNRFFVCVSGSELREHNEKFYMDQVSNLRVWLNGQQLF